MADGIAGEPHAGIRLASRGLLLSLWVLGIALTLVAYWPGMKAGFLFDDAPNILEASSLHLTEVSLRGLGEAIEGSAMPRRWVANVSFALNHAWGGLDPKGFHWVNLWIHIATGLSLGWVAWLYAREASSPEARNNVPLASGAVAIVFLLHPLNVQSVTYVVQRMASLAAFFSLLTLGCYLLARRARSRALALCLLSLSALTWVLALGSKENALVLPLVLVAYEICFHRQRWARISSRTTRRHGAWVVVLAIGALAAMALWIAVGYAGLPDPSWGQAFPDRDFSGKERVLTQLRVQVHYLSLLVLPLPSRLNLEHDIEVSRSLLRPPTTLMAGLFWLAVLGISVRVAKDHPGYAFPVLAYLLLHSIESAPVNLELAFEHRMYLPVCAIALLATTAVADASVRFGRWIVVLVLMLAIPLSVGTHRRNTVWSDELLFHYDCAEKSPEKFRPQLNLGTVLGKAGRSAEAVPFLKKAVRLKPDSGKAHNQLGSAFLRLGRFEEALREFEVAVELDPSNAYAQYNLAWILDRSGRHQEAIVHYREFLILAPEKLASFRPLVLRRLAELDSHP